MDLMFAYTPGIIYSRAKIVSSSNVPELIPIISALLVDDEPVLLDLGTFYLTQREHFSVDTASNGLEALEQIKRRPYQIIISDYDMPCMNGIELLREVKTRYPSQPFVIFTGKGREEVVIEALNLGVDFYLQKGGETKSQYAELAHKCRRAVERRQALDQIRHLARLYSLLSRVNKAVYQLRDRNALISEVCQIAIHQGGFKAAAMSMLNPATGIPEIVAYATSDEFKSADITRFFLPDSLPTSVSLHDDRYFICADNREYPHEPAYSAELLSYGFLSSASFPLRVGDTLIGALTLHGDGAGFFSEEEVLLLLEITESLSVAFELMKQEKEREHIAERLGLVQSAIDCDEDVYYLVDAKGSILYANHAGYQKARTTLSLLSPGDLKRRKITELGVISDIVLQKILSEPLQETTEGAEARQRCHSAATHHYDTRSMARKFIYEGQIYLIIHIQK